MHGIRLLTLLLLLLPSIAWGQAGFLQAVPGTSRPLCTSITHPVTNQTWCADASGAGTDTYAWKIWNGSRYVTAGGDPGAGCSFGGRVTFADASFSAVVTFTTAQPDAFYAVALSTTTVSGTPPAVVARYTAPTTAGFTIEISAPPGTGNVIAATWIASPSSCTTSGMPAVTPPGAASGKRVLCIDSVTNVLYMSSNGTDCSD